MATCPGGGPSVLFPPGPCVGFKCASVPCTYNKQHTRLPRLARVSACALPPRKHEVRKVQSARSRSKRGSAVPGDRGQDPAEPAWAAERRRQPAAKGRGDPSGPRKRQARTPRRRPRRAGARIGSPRPIPSARRPPPPSPARRRPRRGSSLAGRVRTVPGLASARRGGARARAEERRRERN